MESMERAIFAAGCFWHVEDALRKVPGVVSTTVGYSGGRTMDPTYEDVCTGRTGHAEAAEVIFDPAIVTYEELLDVFWGIHDPTTLDRQGPDVGTQYRSAIFYLDEQQRDAALESRDRLEGSGVLGRKRVVTQIVQAGPFYRAEEYHQAYLQKHKRVACGI